MIIKDATTILARSLGLIPQKKKSAGTLMDSGTASLFGGGSGQSEWLKLYNENPRLAVVHKIAQDNGSTSHSIKGVSRGSTYIIEGHPFEAELSKHSSPQFFALWTAYLIMQGIVYIAFDYVDGYPANFKLFTKYHVAKGKIGDDEFQFKYGSSVLTYPKERVIIDTDLDLTNPYFNGIGQAEAIKDEVETDEFVQKYLKRFYINSARPDIIITAEKGEVMTETDIQRIESKWMQKFQGVTNSHKPAFLNWAANVVSVPVNHRELEVLDTRRFYRDTAIQHFGVPPEIMGIVENSNKATVIAAEHIYAKQVRMPKLARMANIINTRILPLYQTSSKLYFEFDNILPDDIELTAVIAAQAVSARAITVNEWRSFFNLPKITNPYGDMIVGSEPPAEVIAIQAATVNSRAFKNTKSFSEYIQEEFVDRASAIIGKELSGDTIIVIEEEKDG